MNKLLLSAFLILNVAFLFAQDKSETYNLEKGEKYITHKNLGDKGFLLQTAKMGIYKKKITILRRFDNDLKQIWMTELESEGQRSFQTPATSTIPTVLIDEKNENYYVIDELPEGATQRVDVVKLDKNGDVIGEYLIKNAVKTFHVLQHIFIVDNELYFISSDGFNYNSGIALKKGEISLHKVDIQNNRLESKILDLPLIEDDKKNSYWFLKGIYNNQLYFTSEKVDENKGNTDYTYQVVSVGLDGSVGLPISLKLDNGEKYVTPSYNRSKRNFIDLEDQDYYLDIHVSHLGPSNEGQEIKSITVNVSAHSDIYIDEYTGDIYIFGLLNDENDKHKGYKTKYNGYFLNVYNSKGEVKWTISEPLEPIYNEDDWVVGSHFFKKQLYLTVTPETAYLQLGMLDADFKIFKFEVFATIETLSFSKDGKKLETSTNDFKQIAKLKPSVIYGPINEYMILNKFLFESSLQGNPSKELPYTFLEDEMCDLINSSLDREIVLFIENGEIKIEYFSRKAN